MFHYSFVSSTTTFIIFLFPHVRFGIDLKDSLVQFGHCIDENSEAQKRKVTHSSLYMLKGAELKQGYGPLLWQIQGTRKDSHGSVDPWD